MATLNLKATFQAIIIDLAIEEVYLGFERQAKQFRNTADKHRKNHNFAYMAQCQNAATRLDLIKNNLCSRVSKFDYFQYSISQNYGVQARNYGN